MKKIDKKVMTSTLITDNWLGSFLNYMPNPDDIVSGTAESYATYRNMLNDGRIKSLINLIKTTALNFPFSIIQGEKCDKDIYDFVKEIALFKNMRKK